MDEPLKEFTRNMIAGIMPMLQNHKVSLVNKMLMPISNEKQNNSLVIRSALNL